MKKVDVVGMDTARAFEELAREAYIMSTCRHPNIARIYGESGAAACCKCVGQGSESCKRLGL